MTLFILVALLTAPLEAATDDSLPRYDRIRAALQKEAAAVKAGETSDVTFEAARTRQAVRAAVRKERDSVWNGVLTGLAAGAGSGYLWARSQCGSNDSECFAIARPAGLIGGAAIGALVGGLLDYFSN